MVDRTRMYDAFYRHAKVCGGLLTVAALCLSTGWAQDRRDDDHYRDRDRIARLEPGTVIPVRTNEGIDADRGDGRIYTGIVDQDVRDNNGRLAIPRGSNVELVVRVARDNDLVLDLDSVMVNGQRYAVKTDPHRVEARRDDRRDDSLVGAIVGAIDGGQARGRAVRIPRDSLVRFRLEQPLDMGVADRGSMRDGRHYHDWDRPEPPR